MSDSLSSFAEAVTKFEELVSPNNRAFLLGAGCSRCAGLPLTSELTDLILMDTSLSNGSKDILAALIKQFEGIQKCNN